MEIIKHFEEFIKDIKNPVVVEIGGCDGKDTKLMNDILLKYTSEYRYHVFEPDIRFRKHYRDILQKYKNVRFYPFAVGTIEGETTFYSACDTYFGASSIKKPDRVEKIFPGLSFTEYKVTVKKLDYIKEDHIDFLWIDAQGADREILESIDKTVVDAVFCEYYSDHGGLYEGDGGKVEIIAVMEPTHYVAENYGADLYFRRKA